MINTYATTLEKKIPLAEGILLMRFKLKEPNQISFIAGQYVILQIPALFIDKLRQSGRLKSGSLRTVTERGAVRQYSICSSPRQSDHFDLLVGIVDEGLASAYFQEMAIGAETIFQGPAGVFTLKPTTKDKIFLATGTGIAPIKSMLETVLSNKLPVISGLSSKYYLFWGLKRQEEVYFLDDFKKLANDYENFKFKICLSRQDDFSNLDQNCFVPGRVNVNTEQMIASNPTSYEYYLCGDRIIVEALRQFLIGLGVKKEAVIFEKFV